MLILLVLFAGGFTYGVHAYRAETENKAAGLVDEPEGADYIEANVKITSVDPIKGEMNTKIEFAPMRSFATEDGVKLKRPLKLVVNSNNAKQEYAFEAGKRMLQLEAVIDLYEGEVADFPFDKHMGELKMYFEPGTATPKPNAAPDEEPAASPVPTSKKPGGKTLDPEEIPVFVSLYGTVSGLKIDASKSKEDAVDYVDIDLRVSRANTALAFSYFIMTIQWALTVGVSCITFLVLTGRRKVEFGLLGYFGGLLFAFPALRNSMPGTPPIGTFGDFISFFWVEMILALCLFAIMMKYLLTLPSK